MINKNKQDQSEVKKKPKFIFDENNNKNEQVINVKYYQQMLMVDDQVDIYMPNQIFDDFLKCNSFENWSQRAFAYTYYYLTSYLYRNCIYGKALNIKDYGLVSIKNNLLKISSHKLNHIYTKGGILDQLEYTISTNDYPIQAIFEDNTLLKIETRSQAINRTKQEAENQAKHFPTNSNRSHTSHTSSLEYIQETPSAFSIKVPVKGLKDLKGHFFNIENTHKIQIEAFIACMSNPSLGYRGFFLYAFYRMNSDKFKNGYRATFEKIQKEIGGINTNTFKLYNRELSKMNLIKHKVIPYQPSIYKANSELTIINIE